ncbi:3' terminal RNA ribose 2'-O-methyltransferase Hen1 [Adhaeribacter sp. BT258]|uniref:Small RNA 2'-O-methyltransferase n=1 Tax=Adhaeribacter terrigena TaxID=2793070 RepID=A0ABS1BZM5_9BACT|nr:3' terminal RNA ribose 2'-O-methyltransferase Hen1 [Adhaeribacter terrigena]MBK0402604.1 3' terminal RNA ribose 2'-O-methyltransferase Hen1 [Adhaeribacter terrigena]
MILEITTTYQPATDLGYLLHKHPDKLQTVALSTGKAHIFYPEASPEICTACLMLDINPVELVRSRKSPSPTLQEHYVNDRPYTSNSFLSSAITKAFGSALNGKCNARPELVDTPMPFTVKLASLKADGGPELLEKLFGPLGYATQFEQLPLDERFPGWGLSKYVNLELRHTLPLKALLSHLYVLIPVLDNDKHFWISRNDIEILLQKGQGWLEDHPEKEWITRRYFKNLRRYSNEALLRLAGEEALAPEEPENAVTLNLHQQRLQKAFELLKASGAGSVLDLGCGEGKLLKLLLQDGQFKKLTGMDVSFSSLQKAKENLHLSDAAPALRERLSLFQGSVTYQDERLSGYDALAMVEVIEHLDEERLPAMEKVVFGLASPPTIVLSTPNAEYNVIYQKLQAEDFRHEDHRFEWSRPEFRNWCEKVGEQYGYRVSISPVGPEEPEVGAPSQIAVFTKK